MRDARDNRASMAAAALKLYEEKASFGATYCAGLTYCMQSNEPKGWGGSGRVLRKPPNKECFAACVPAADREAAASSTESTVYFLPMYISNIGKKEQAYLCLTKLRQVEEEV